MSDYSLADHTAQQFWGDIQSGEVSVVLSLTDFIIGGNYTNTAELTTIFKFMRDPSLAGNQINTTNVPDLNELLTSVLIRATSFVNSKLYLGHYITVRTDGLLDVGNTQIINVAEPTASDHAATMSFVNTAVNVQKQRIDDIMTATTIAENGTAAFIGNLTGNVVGNVVGNVNGNLTGDVIGNLTGTASAASTITTTSDNTATTCFIPFTNSTAGTSKSLLIDDNVGPLTYNPSNGNLTATTFTGTASSASTITTTSDNTATTCFIPFTNSTAGTSKSLLIDDNVGPLTYNPSNGNLTATTFTGTASSASTITTTSDNTATTCFIPFIKSTAGTSKSLFIDDNVGPLTYNPSNGNLTATTLTGNVVGNLTGTATLLNITSDNSNTTCFIPFAKTSGTGSKDLFIDDLTTPLTYNPFTGILTSNSIISNGFTDLHVATRTTTHKINFNNTSITGNICYMDVNGLTMAAGKTITGNLNGGVSGAVIYQSAVSTTAFTGAGVVNSVLTNATAATPTWVNNFGIVSGVITRSANYTITTSEFGKIVLVSGQTEDVVITLPVSGITNFSVITIVNRNTLYKTTVSSANGVIKDLPKTVGNGSSGATFIFYSAISDWLLVSGN